MKIALTCREGIGYQRKDQLLFQPNSGAHLMTLKRHNLTGCADACGFARGIVCTAFVLGLLNSASSAANLFTENFDSMGPAGASLPAGWSAGFLGVESSSNRLVFDPVYTGNSLSLTNMPVVASDGSALPAPNVGTVMNLGLPGDSDRALGGYPRTTPSGDQVYQVAIINTTGQPLTDVTITYAGEQWSQAQGTSSSGPEMLRFLASSSSPIDGFLHYDTLDWTAPNQGPGAVNPTALNGNDPLNRTVVTATITLPSPVAPGDTLYLRWHDWNDNSTTDHFLAVDDLSVTYTPIPEPSILGFLGLATLGSLRRRTIAKH